MFANADALPPPPLEFTCMSTLGRFVGRSIEFPLVSTTPFIPLVDTAYEGDGSGWNAFSDTNVLTGNAVGLSRLTLISKGSTTGPFGEMAQESEKRDWLMQDDFFTPSEAEFLVSTTSCCSNKTLIGGACSKLPSPSIDPIASPALVKVVRPKLN